jgi:4-amino-4-deoxy-L-arabinose transferase-like glycosyltransferase
MQESAPIEPLRREPGIPRALAAAVVLSLALLHFAGLGTIPLMDPDEGRYAEIPREMLATGDFVTPHLNGVAYLEKPPLYYWGSAASMAVLGQDEFGARFFGASVALLGVLLAWWMGSELAGPRTGMYGALLLSTTLYHYVIGRLNATDMTVGVMLVLAIFPSYLHLSGRRASRGWLYLGFAGAGLAFLAKGLIGVVFPAAILFLWAVLAKRPRALLKLFSPAGIAIFLAIVLPWLVLVTRANPDFLHFFFVREHFQRFSTERIHHRAAPFWFFFPIVAGGLVPWLAFLPAGLRACRESAGAFLEREDRRFLAVWILFVLGFFTLSSSKLPTYMTPIFPPLAVFGGRLLACWEARGEHAPPARLPLAAAALLAAGILLAPRFAQDAPRAAEWAPLVLPSCLAILAFGAAPLLARRAGAGRAVLASAAMLGLFLFSLNRPAAALIGANRSGKQIAEILNREMRAGDALVQFRAYVQSVPFYTKRRSILVEQVGELEYGMRCATDRCDWYLDRAAFDNLWRSDRRVFCIFNRDCMPLIEAEYPRHRLLLRSRRGILVVNR